MRALTQVREMAGRSKAVQRLRTTSVTSVINQVVAIKSSTTWVLQKGRITLSSFRFSLWALGMP